MARTHGERLDRLEQVIQILAEDQVSLQKIVASWPQKPAAGLIAFRNSLKKPTSVCTGQTTECGRQTTESIN